MGDVAHPTPPGINPGPRPAPPAAGGAPHDAARPASDSAWPERPGVDGDHGAGFPLRVTDLKNWRYCPRVVYYHYVQPVAAAPTGKMRLGKEMHERIERLERRRKLRRYGLEHAVRRFDVTLYSNRLGLSGRLDLLLTTPGGRRIPVDYKDTRGPVRRNHLAQLAAYALLVEERFGGVVDTGFIYRLPDEDATVVPITAELRHDVVADLAAIRAMIVTESFPDPAPRSRCWDCEYRNYCGDVF